MTVAFPLQSRNRPSSLNSEQIQFLKRESNFIAAPIPTKMNSIACQNPAVENRWNSMGPFVEVPTAFDLGPNGDQSDGPQRKGDLIFDQPHVVETGNESWRFKHRV